MRTNLITHFHCTNCGNQLNVEYGGDNMPKPIEAQYQTEKEPTGACCRYNRIFVEPCRACIKAATGPAEQLTAAIRAMTERGKP